MTATADTTAVGVDIGGTKIAAAAVDWSTAEASIVGPVRRRSTPTGGADEVIAATAALVDEVARPTGSSAPPVGIGVAGMVRTDGYMIAAPNTSALIGVHLPAAMTRAIGRPVLVANDVNCAAVAEHRTGAGVGHDDLVMVNLGTGIGGGLIMDGEVRAGAHGLAAEVGHMVLDPEGPDCPCGRRGCWERYASGTGLARLARLAADAGRLPGQTAEAGGDPAMVTGEQVVAAARSGDAEARAVLGEFSWWLARGLSVLAAVLDPGLFVLGGGLVDTADLWIDETRSSFLAQVVAPERRPPIAIEAAAHGSIATAIGAALLAHEGSDGEGAVGGGR